jgi:acetolactate synthase-1/2/3 large subunit
MAEKSAAQAMVESLLVHGVDTVFGLPGAQMYPLFDALYNHQDKIRTIGARHEQGIAYMAFGYARSSGRLGVFSPVPGPGMLNTTAAMCTSQGTCSPTLCLTGEVPSAFYGKGRGHLHELTDQLGILERLTKHARHIENPLDTPSAIRDAIAAAMSGRQGPAALSICWDTLGQPADIGPALDPADPTQSAPNGDQIDACVNLINSARNPMIFTGSGAQHAAKEIAALSELLRAPVVGFRGGRGIVGEDQPLGLSMAAAWKLWQETDLLIGVGSRMEVPFMRWSGMMRYTRRINGKSLIRIDIDATEMEKLDTDAPLVADSAIGVGALVGALVDCHYTSHRDMSLIHAAKESAALEIRKVQPQMDYLDAIRAVLPRDGFFVEELSQMGFASNFGFPVYEPRTYVSCGYQGTLGFGFPTALGVKVANPDKAVVSVTGDGGFMFAMPELATAEQYGINLVTIVFDNGSYGNVRRDQQTRFDNRLIGADLINPDFAALAEAFGVKAYSVKSPHELRSSLDHALKLDAPALIHVKMPTGCEVSPWQFIHPNG